MSDRIHHDDPEDLRALIDHIMRVEGVPYPVARTRALSYWCDPLWRHQQRAIEVWKFVAWLMFLMLCLAISGIVGFLWGLLT